MAEQVFIKTRSDLKESQTTHKKYFTVTDGTDRTLLCFVPGLHGELQVGQTYNIELNPPNRPDGQYSIKSLVKNQVEKPPTEVFQPTNNMTKEDWAERDRTTRTSIERQKALEEANRFVCEMRKLQGKPVEGDSGLVVKVARSWEGYLSGDIKEEEDIKPKPKQETKSKTELPYEKIPY